MHWSNGATFADGVVETAKNRRLTAICDRHHPPDSAGFRRSLRHSLIALSLLDPAALGGTPLVCGDSHDDADSADADGVRNAVTEFLVDNMGSAPMMSAYAFLTLLARTLN